MKKNESNFKDVTTEILGTKNEPTKKPPVKKEVVLPEGFELMNPPVIEKARKEVVIPKEIMDSLKTLDKLFLDSTKNFVKIGYELFGFQESKNYKALGFKNFEEFVKSQYSLSRASAYNFVKCCVKYSAIGEDGKPTNILGKEYMKYSSSQLVAMLSLDEETILNIDPDKTVREIKKLVKNNDSNFDSEFNPDSDSYAGVDGEENATPEKGKKVNVRDTNVPVFRLNFGSGSTWESVINDKNKDLVNAYLNDEKRKADGKDYRLELNVVYLDIPET